MLSAQTAPPALSFAPMEGSRAGFTAGLTGLCFPVCTGTIPLFYAPTADSPLSGRGLTDMHPDHNQGVPVVPQLLTNRAEDFLSAAKLLQDLGYREVNLNLGCPSGTVTAKGKGAGFLSKPQQLDEFLDVVFHSLDLTVSIKTRVGVASPRGVACPAGHL